MRALLPWIAIGAGGWAGIGCDARAEAPAPVVPGADLRGLVAELAAARACELLRGTFHAVPAGGAAGMLWLRGCEASAEGGGELALRLDGSGWVPRPGGGHARAAVRATLRGRLDVAYDAAARVAAVRLSPAVPEVAIEPAAHQADAPVIAAALEAALARADPAAAGRRPGAPIDLCGALPGAGASRAAGPREVSLASGDLVLVGPRLVDRGLVLDATATHGAMRVVLACAEHAPAVIDAFLGNRRVAVPTLMTGDVAATTRVRLPSARCPVVLIARALDERATLVWRWEGAAVEAPRAPAGLTCGGAPPSPSPPPPRDDGLFAPE